MSLNYLNNTCTIKLIRTPMSPVPSFANRYRTLSCAVIPVSTLVNPEDQLGTLDPCIQSHQSFPVLICPCHKSKKVFMCALSPDSAVPELHT